MYDYRHGSVHVAAERAFDANGLRMNLRGDARRRTNRDVRCLYAPAVELAKDHECFRRREIATQRGLRAEQRDALSRSLETGVTDTPEILPGDLLVAAIALSHQVQNGAPSTSLQPDTTPASR